jgi:hypothetical protein
MGFNPVSDILRLTASGSLDTDFATTGKASIPFANFSSFVSDPSGRLVFANVASSMSACVVAAWAFAAMPIQTAMRGLHQVFDCT